MWASAENAEAEAAAEQKNLESGPFSNANLSSIYEQLDIENAKALQQSKLDEFEEVEHGIKRRRLVHTSLIAAEANIASKNKLEQSRAAAASTREAEAKLRV